MKRSGPLDDLADPATDGCGDAPGGVPVGAQVLAEKKLLKGQHDRGGRDDAGSQCSVAFDCAARQRRTVQRVSDTSGEGERDRDADAGAVGEAGPEAAEEGIQRRMAASA